MRQRTPRYPNKAAQATDVVPALRPHPRWIAEPKYRAMHARLDEIWGQPRICDNCGTLDARTYEWALHDGADDDNLRVSPDGRLYSIEPLDYSRLCRHCHRQREGHRGWRRAS